MLEVRQLHPGKTAVAVIFASSPALLFTAFVIVLTQFRLDGLASN